MSRAGVALILLLAACKPPEPPKSGGPPGGRGRRAFPVQVKPVAVEDVRYTIEAVGSLEAKEEVRVTARVGGVLEKVSFQEGDSVTTDSVLAEIDRNRYQMLQDRAQAVHDKARVELEKAELFLKNRMELLQKDPSFVTKEELANVTSQVHAARATMAETKAALDLAGEDLRNSQVRSLVAGIINTKSVSTGQYVSPGTPIATIVDRSRLLLRFKVPEAESVKMRRLLDGGELAFSVRPIPGRSFQARLVHISPQAHTQTRTVECLAEVQNPDDALKPGFFAVVRAVVETREKAVVVPDTAILPTDKGFIAFVVKDAGENKVAVERRVVPGLFVREGVVEIVSGLAPGEPLVVTGAAALRDGAELQVGGGPKRPAAPGKGE
jgi:multidrug efflux system membrane fusion protein